MPDHLKALLVILVLASFVFAFARRPVCALAIAPADFMRRRNLWIAVTLIAFLSHNFWVYVLASGLLLSYVAPRDSNRIALYFFLLFTIPQIPQEIPGFGGIRMFFAVDYVRILALAVLLPMAFVLRRREIASGERLTLPDKLLLAFLLLNMALQFFAISITGTMRNAFYSFVDVFLPYYVVSRSLRDLESFRDALMSFVVATALLAVVGIFEFAWHWLLYRPLDGALGVPWGYGGYLSRGDDTLRAVATTGQPIVLGYAMAVGLGFFLFAQRSMRNRAAVLACFILLLAGEIAPVSRGPWIGAVVIYLIFLATGPHAVLRIGRLAAIGIALMPVVTLTPYWGKIVDYLPFIGEVDEGNLTYRQRLLELSIDIILENPLFGSADFVYFLEELRQGQGIIDIVNSYLMIGLRSGLTGLGLFLAFFGVVMIGILKRMRALPSDSELHQLGQALFATLAGILVMIFSVSSINAVPVIYWATAGLGLAYVRMGKPTVTA